MRVDIEFKVDFEEVRDAIEHVLDDIDRGPCYSGDGLPRSLRHHRLCNDIIYCQSETGAEYFECVVEDVKADAELVQHAIQKMMAKAGYNVRVIAKEG
jgi:hypothetical protein